MTGGVIPSKANQCPSGSERFAQTEVVLTLGDVLPAISTENLRAGLHDDDRELRFRADEISTDPAQGTASIELSLIVAQCPDVFQPGLAPPDAATIRVPLRKLRRPASIQQSSEGAQATPAIETVVGPDPFDGMSSSIVPDEFIQLSLAVLLKRCPREILVGSVPSVDQTVRISLPFGPIARQLPTGRVEVSSPRFVSALPAELTRYFRPQADVKVPLPLQEIFQNLPGHRSRVTQRAPLLSREADLGNKLAENETSTLGEMTRRPLDELPQEVALASADRDSDMLGSREQMDDRLEKSLTSEAALPAQAEILSPTRPDSASLISEQASRLDLSSPEMKPVVGSPDVSHRSAVSEIAAPPHVGSHPIAVASRQCDEVPSDGESGDREFLHSNATSPQSEPMRAIHESLDTRGEPAISGSTISEAGNPVMLPIVPPPIILRATPPPPVTVGPVEPERTQLVRTARDAVTAVREEVIRDVRSALPDCSTICRDIVALPGVLACLLFNGKQIVQTGDIPGDIEPSKLPELSSKVMESLEKSGFAIRSAVQQFTFHSDPVAITFFIPGAISLCAIFHARDLLPFVREKIAAAAEKIESSILS